MLQDRANCSNRGYKHAGLRAYDISRSEKATSNITTVLSEEYLNPFDPTLEEDKIFNLSSGVPLENNTVLQCQDIGREKQKEFINKRLETDQVSFHAPIKRVKINLFSDATKTVVSKGGKNAIIEVNRDIISKLLALFAKTGRQIDFKSALAYPLTTVPLSIANPDGSRRTTQKSKMLEFLSLKDEEEPQLNADVFIIDLMAQIRVLTKEVPDTYEEFVIKFLHSIPKGYARIDIVADTYREKSIKSSERNKRGNLESQKIMINSEKSKMPRDFQKFLRNGDNKSRLIELIFEYVINHRSKCLQIVKSNKIVLSGDCFCKEVTLSSVREGTELNSNQEEADTKVILHTISILENTSVKVHLRSPSADTDILIIALALVTSPNRVFFDNGTGKNRTCFTLDQYDVSNEDKSLLIGFHALTGNDYISSFFRKGKKLCWKVLKANEEFQQAFRIVGDDWELSDEVIKILEKFVCKLYNSGQTSVNAARFQLFDKKFVRENKAIDLSLIPPLLKHLQRSNYVAKIWKSSIFPIFECPHPGQFGWNGDMEIEWCADIFPTEIESLLFDCVYSDGKSDDESDEEQDGEHYFYDDTDDNSDEEFDC